MFDKHNPRVFYTLITVGLLILLIGLVGCGPIDQRRSVHEDRAAASSVLVGHVQGHGSGVVVGQNRVLTNRHVVEGVMGGVVILFDNGNERASRVLWKGEGTVDLALIEVDTGDAPVAEIDCSRSPRGREVFTYGNPLAFRGVMTWGHVATNNENFADQLADAQLLDMHVIPGNSGGGVWSAADGRLVGIATAMITHNGSITGHSVMLSASAICREVPHL